MADQTRIRELSENYNAVKLEIENAAKAANVPSPRLIAVSKYKPVEDIKALYDLGHRHFGENYVQELTEKAQQLPKDINWHFIGALQTNKCKVLAPIPNIFAIQTLDSESKAQKLNNSRPDSAPAINIYLQINTSGEEEKSGIAVSDVDQIETLAVFIVEKCPRLRLEGLMTIGSLAVSTARDPNTDFTKLVDLRNKLRCTIGRELDLSMGMSNDYVEAIRQGTTNVRVGSAIFGSRKTKEEIKPS
jgi:PLP dependent protein